MRFVLAARYNEVGDDEVGLVYVDESDSETLDALVKRHWPHVIYFYASTYEDPPVIDIEGQPLILTKRRLWRYNKLDPKESYSEYGWPHDIYYDVATGDYVVSNFPEDGEWWRFDRPIPENMDDFYIETPEYYQTAAGTVTSRFRVRMEKG